MKKCDVVKFKNPSADEIEARFILLENPDGDRVLVEAIVDMIIRPTYIFRTEELTLDKLPAAVELGRRGGRSTSDAKRASSAANGKRGGRPRKS